MDYLKTIEQALKTPEGREVLRKLAPQIDVVRFDAPASK